MGCTDRESNFQKDIFHDGEWWSTTGYTPSWEGPREELIKKFPDYAEPRFQVGDDVYSAEQIEDNTVIVKPLGKASLNAANI